MSTKMICPMVNFRHTCGTGSWRGHDKCPGMVENIGAQLRGRAVGGNVPFT